MLTMREMHRIKKVVAKGTPRGRCTEPTPEPAPEQKILTIHDLPRRNRVMQNFEAIRAKSIVTPALPGKILGPKRFSDYVGNGAWAGRRCFIIGGGPSVKKLDLSLLHDEMTIGTNRAYELLTPSILYGVDGQLWGWAEQGKFGEESKRKFNAYKGYKVWMALHNIFPSDFYLIDVDDREGDYRIGDTSRLAFKGNSGYGALNLAAALGANPIYLIGFDMKGDGKGNQSNWHNGYPMTYSDGVYTSYLPHFVKFAPVLRDSGIEVINLTAGSALHCFEKKTYAKVVKAKPVVPAKAIQVMTRPGMITAITPTGDRPLAFALCKHWMETQTVRPDQWLVIDDGKVPMEPSAMMDYVRRTPKKNDPKHTLNVNMKAAIPYIKGDKIIIIEDDEYYAPNYIETMAKKLDEHEVVGLTRAKYYHLPTGGFLQISNTLNASLAQTGFLASFLSDLKDLLREEKSLYLDMRIWRHVMVAHRGYLFNDNEESLYTGIKGLPGRKGIGQGHVPSMYGKSIDTNRAILEKWIPRDYGVYIDVLNGKLTDETCSTYFPQITGIMVCQNTKELVRTAYTSIRKFHPNMPIIIVDGSDPGDPCAVYVKSLESPLTTVCSLGYNIGHGKGMAMGIDKVRTPYALFFDSDVEMLESPVDGMLDMMEPDTFGVGYMEYTDFDGFGIGARQAHLNERMKYLHPYFQLVKVDNYYKYQPYVHHGAPCYLTMLDIHKRGISDKVLKEFPGLGHSAKSDYGWKGEPRRYVRHDVMGTRSARLKKGLSQIEGNWAKNKGVV